MLSIKQHNLLLKQAEDNRKRRDSLEIEIKSDLQEYMRNCSNLFFVFGLGYLGTKDGSDSTQIYVKNLSAETKLDNVPKAILKKITEFHKITRDSRRAPTIEEVRKEMKEKVMGQISDGSKRIEVMLSNPVVSSAMDKLIKKLNRDEKEESAINT